MDLEIDGLSDDLLLRTDFGRFDWEELFGFSNDALSHCVWVRRRGRGMVRKGGGRAAQSEGWKCARRDRGTKQTLGGDRSHGQTGRGRTCEPRSAMEAWASPAVGSVSLHPPNATLSPGDSFALALGERCDLLFARPPRCA